ncbi:ATP-binding cassette domain-containing protein, partial [Nocardia elegans]|uniref:ATP-binding cassette domain-containing protein n=1 Tax=Nocardia elegans TaxID=300029 RepID=UPI001E37BDF5
TVAGLDVATQAREVRSRIGLTGQYAAVDEVLTGRQNLEMFGRLFHLGGRRARARAAELLERFDLTDAANRGVGKYSGGMRRRLDLAASMILAPDVLFLDEPTAGFDPQARREFHDLVHRLADDQQTAILLTTHDLDEAEKLADRILILAGGRIIADGSADELSRRIAGEAEVRWTRDGQRFVHTTAESTEFVHDLFIQHGDRIRELEVRRASLEDTYMTLVRQFESGDLTDEVRTLEEVRR